MPWVWLSIVWIASCSAIGYALFITKNPHCLWALLIPASMGFTSRPSACKHEDEE